MKAYGKEGRGSMPLPVRIRWGMNRTPPLVIDTNVFVAALFRPDSHAGQLVEQVRQGLGHVIWNRETRRETQAIVQKIPPIDWASIANLFLQENEFRGPTEPVRFRSIPDPDDRKFAALAHAVDAILISQDDDLLAHPERLDVLVLTPREFLQGAWRRPA